MARSSELNATSRSGALASSPSQATKAESGSLGTKYEDLVYMKKGWLIKQAATDKESKKHWFVLAGNSLRYFRDVKTEESNTLDGRIDLSTCYEVSEVVTHRNYGFRIKTRNGEYLLAAMTSGIRNNWMKAIRLCMELHSSVQPKRVSSPFRNARISSTLSPPRTALDDLEFKSGATRSSTAAVTGAGGETAFHLVGRKDPYKRDTQKPARRHHSDVNPGNVSKVFTVKEFSTSSIDTPADPLASSGSSTRSSDSRHSSLASDGNTGAHDRGDLTPRASKIPRHHSPSSEASTWSRASSNRSTSSSSLMKRFVEGSDNLPATPGALSKGPQTPETVRPRRSITSESNKEEVKREMMRRAKSPSARVKERSRAAKTPRLHSPITAVDDSYSYLGSTASDTGSVLSDTATDEQAIYTDIGMSEDEFLVDLEDTDQEEVASTTTSITPGGDDALLEILETEVESLKDRLELTQTELDMVHKDNKDLKTRLHKESSTATSQSMDSGYSTLSRYGQSVNQSESMKRQLKESRETVQRQRLDIESLKSKLDMSVSKLTGTEKALSEALRDYKQEKDKFLKLSSDWNRRIRTMESQCKDSVHKLERSRENLQSKERECRRLEHEVKAVHQRTREQEKEILKLKAVEHEYNQLKEKLDDREQEVHSLQSELKEKEHQVKKQQVDQEVQLEELHRDFQEERQDLEQQLDQVKHQLYQAHDRQSSMTDTIHSDIADMLKEKDDIIAQLEEKMIETDKKMVDLSEELHAEMGENADLSHSLQELREDKMRLHTNLDKLESQLLVLKTKVSGFENENFSLRKQLEELHRENTQLHDMLTATQSAGQDDQGAQQENLRLQRTITDLNKQIQNLQTQLQASTNSLNEQRQQSVDRVSSTVSSVSDTSSDQQRQDLLQNVLLADSRLKDVNSMLFHLRQDFDAYLDTLSDDVRPTAIRLADLIEEVGHKCQDIEETLRESDERLESSSDSGSYRHIVTVSTQSSGKVIMEEYQGLKVKFDQTVSELRKVKKDLGYVTTSRNSLRLGDHKLKEQVAVMEGAYKQQIVELIARVDGLTDKIVCVQSQSSTTPTTSTKTTTKPPFSTDSTGSVVTEIEKQLDELDSRITSLEQQASRLESQPVSKPAASKTPPSSTEGLSVKLDDICSQLEEANSKIKSLSSSFPESVSESTKLQSKLDSCKGRLGSLSASLQSGGDQGVVDSHTRNQQETSAAAAGVSACLSEIKEKIQEIGEQLDSLEEDDEDSDSEDEGEQTTVEDIREKLANLTEYIEQHSKLNTSDWALVRLLNVQKEHLQTTKASMDTDVLTEEQMLKIYSGRLSLEAVILSEMADLLQRKDTLVPEDSVCREIDALGSQLLTLHQRLDAEMRTMHFEDLQSDVITAYADLVADKILVTSQLCSATFDQKSHKDANSESSAPQPLLLATEALFRSQIDAFIGDNLDHSAEDVFAMPSHLTARSVIQGEITHALRHLRHRMSQHPEVLTPGSASYQFMFDRLLSRYQTVLHSLENYERQVCHSLAVIIFKESEEMTIVEGPESVLEAMCSELSTIMETHIQRYKEKCRSAMDTHSARKYDVIVNELRTVRETVLCQINSQHAAYAKDQSSVRDSSLDIPVQSLDSTINNFAEIMSLKAVVSANINFLMELLKMEDNLLQELELEQDSDREDRLSVEKGLSSFVHSLSESLTAEALSKEALSRKVIAPAVSSQSEEGQSSESVTDLVLHVPDLSMYPSKLGGLAETMTREAVFSAQLTFCLFKQKLLHSREMSEVKIRRPLRSRPDLNPEESRDSDDTLDFQTDYQAMLIPLEEVMESKHEDELQVLQVVKELTGQLKTAVATLKPCQGTEVEDRVRQLEQKLCHELDLASQRHTTHLEVFKQECSKVEKSLEELHQDRDHYEDRSAQLEEELTTLQLQHEEEKERVKQDILTAVHAIRSNDEKSGTDLIEKASRLDKELSLQKVHFRKVLSSIKKELSSKDKSALALSIEEHLSSIKMSTEEEEEDYQPPLPSQPPPDVPDGGDISTLEEHSIEVKDNSALDLSHHEHEVEQLKKEKEEALAEEMRNTKAALDAMRKAYEEELGQEKAKYKEALVTMYTEEYVNEIKLRHQEDETKMGDELQKVNMHYSSKCEDYKLMEMKLQQTKQDYESHITQLISSNDHLEELLNQEIDSLKDFIKNRPAKATLITGSATMEEELYDAKIMVRVKDTELQKLRSQVKNLENSLHRTTEEQRQTMTQYMQSLKTSGEMKKQYQEEITQLTDKLNKVLGSQGLKANIRRTHSSKSTDSPVFPPASKESQPRQPAVPS